MSESRTIVQPLEIAAGQVFGEARTDPLPPSTLEPLQALERVLADALRTPPCFVAFSGGRDSSALLAVAARVAREQGFELPIPVTGRFGNVPTTVEDEWQELVIRHLGLSDWDRIEFGSDLDLVGPVATRALARYGHLYPPNTHFFLPLLERARGGSLVNGIEGDLIFGGWRWATLADARGGRRRPEARDIARALHAYAPVPVRRTVGMRRDPGPATPWLTEAARRKMNERRAHHYLLQPVRFESFVRWAACRSAVVIPRRQIEKFAEDLGARSISPFADPVFLAAYAAAGRRDGFGDRTETMRRVFGKDLPDRVLARRDKARFDGAYFSDHSRALAAGWDGTGFDPELVHPERLREEWRKPVAPFRTGMLLQALWLDRASTLAG